MSSLVLRRSSATPPRLAAPGAPSLVARSLVARSLVARSLAALLTAVGCGPASTRELPPDMRAAQTSAEMRSAVERRIRVGQPMAAARRAIEAAGFTCEPGLGASGARATPDRFLECHHRRPGAEVRSWTVYLASRTADTLHELVVTQPEFLEARGRAVREVRPDTALAEHLPARRDEGGARP
jgi:hypothetical protein